jgi:phosphomannomutase / phosphoglucomutase
MTHQTHEKSKRPAGRDTPLSTRLVVGLIVAVLVSTGVTFYLWKTLIVSEREQQLARFSEQYLKTAVSNLASHWLGLQKKVAFFAQSREVEDALAAQDQSQLRRIRLNIIGSFPEADGVRLIATGTAELNLDAPLPLRFSDMEMIERTEQRNTITPEAVKLSMGWRLNFALPIPTDASKPVVGTLLITAPLDSLFEALMDGVADKGEFSFLQTYPGGEHVLFSAGAGGFLPPVRKPVEGTPWVVQYAPSSAIEAGLQINWSIFALGAALTWLVALGTAFAVNFIFARKQERRQKAINTTYERLGQVRGESTAFAPVDIRAMGVEEDLLGFDEPEPQSAENEPPADTEATDSRLFSPTVFRAYDIRGVAQADATRNAATQNDAPLVEITPEFAQRLGQALGTEALDIGESSLFVARDARTHSPLLAEYLVRGVLSTGCHVINIGTVPSPLLYFAVETQSGCRSGVIVTASHNGPEYNGFKIVMQGRTRADKDLEKIRDRMEQGLFHSGHGEESRRDLVPSYIDTITADIALGNDIHVVLDAGNGVTGKVAPSLFEALGCRVTALYCDLDGTFPHHGPDPTQEANLRDVINKVTEVGADLGIAFDGDGDRLMVVTGSGKILWSDRLLMLFAKDILQRNPGADVVFDVKSSRHLNNVITQFGGRPILWKTGHAPMKAKMLETGALLGGEYAGHIFIKERWFGFDDGLYVGARLVEILSLAEEDLDTLMTEFPEWPSTPEVLVPVAEAQKMALMARLQDEGDFQDAKVTSLDGLRLEFAQGWGLVRASNTGPYLTLRAEASSREQLHDIKALLTRELRKLDPALVPKW